MSQTNPKTLHSLEIDNLSHGPFGVGRIDGKAVMVTETAPGDTVDALIVESKDRYARGRLSRVIHPSPLRQTAPCRYVGACGGCSWQHLRYGAQLEAKQRNVVEALKRIGRIDNFELLPIIPSPKEYRYRRRIRLHTGGNGKLGFFRAFSHDIVEIGDCLIAAPVLSAMIDPLRRWVRRETIPFLELEIVMSERVKPIVVVGRVARDYLPQDEQACLRLMEHHETIGGVVLQGPRWRKTWGETTISLPIMDDLRTAVEADAFTQVNSEANQRIVVELLQSGAFTPEDRVLELFCGAGNFTLPLAKRVRQVVAVEDCRPAIASAKLSAQFNGLDNIRWMAAPAAVAVARLRKRHGAFSRLVLNPPRSGAKGMARDLASFGADKILYVSCDPPTLARDLGALTSRGYKLRSIQTFDLFPQTYHVEALAVLTRS